MEERPNPLLEIKRDIEALVGERVRVVTSKGRRQVIEREVLFSRVWETQYTGDTRTLDVHISWLRQAIEDDPRHPRFIKTIRGLGYRLDIEETHPLNGRQRALESTLRTS